MSRSRRRAAVVAPLAATALGLGLGTGTAGAALESRTDSFTFSNRAGASVTCTVDSVQGLSDDGSLTVSTTLSGPAECTASFMDIGVVYRHRSTGESDSAYQESRGTSLSYSVDDVAVPIRSEHIVLLDACDCLYRYELRQSK
jgi:hypothetical protein